MNIKKLKEGDQVELVKGSVVTIKDITAKFLQTRFEITYDELENVSFFYNQYGNITGPLNNYSIRKKVEPVKVVAPPSEFIKFSVSLLRADDRRYMRLLSECFGLQRNDIPRPHYNNYSEKMEIVCRPDQFAQFLIERNNRGFTNLVKELNAEYVDVFSRKVLLVYVAENY